MKRPLISSLFGVSLVCLLTSLPAQTHAALLHEYELNGTYADSFGGPALTPLGGTLTASNYAFTSNQGLSLSGGLASGGTYSILIDFRFSDLSGYRKIVDFKNLSSDNGLYNLSTSLDFYNVTTGPAGAFTANETVRLVITRDDASDLFTSYVDGVQQLSFTDTGELGLFSGANSIIHFVIDDLAIGGEASAGVVDRIAIYDSALSTADVAALGGPTASVPEPGNILAALGIIGVSLAGRRRR